MCVRSMRPQWRWGRSGLACAGAGRHGAAQRDHLFCDGEFDHALRDLADLDDLLRHFGADEALVWRRRGPVLGLARPLYYAIVQGDACSACRCRRRWTRCWAAAPGPLTRRLMDALLERAMPPEHASCDRSFSGVARERCTCAAIICACRCSARAPSAAQVVAAEEERLAQRAGGVPARFAARRAAPTANTAPVQFSATSVRLG